MKKIFVLSVSLVVLSISSWSQTSTKLSSLLQQYYAIKDALVAGNVAKASADAASFSKSAEAIDAKTLSLAEQNVFKSLQGRLIADANTLSAAKDINKQREVFAILSNAMISVAKSVALSDKEIYVDYCPMKKTKWLSADKAIKNPYYGNSMLTCGNVAETIKH